MKLTAEQLSEIQDKIMDGLSILSDEITHISFDECTDSISVSINMMKEYDDSLISIQIIL